MKQTIIEKFYRAQHDQLVNYVAKRLMSSPGGHEISQEAEDIVHDMFVRLLRCQAIIETTLPAMALQTLNRLLTDHWRHLRCVERHETVVRRSGGETSGEIFSMISARYMNELLERRIASFDITSARILHLRLHSGLSTNEIAETLGLNYKAVENRLYASRKRLKRMVAGM